jgi:choline dehydrogenase-like flavoprotein
MEVADLAAFEPGTLFETDLVIVGGGPAGLTIAREFANSSTRVIVLESGLLNETPIHAALSELENVGEPRTAAQKQKRSSFHAADSQCWSPELQPYGVRCRALGGSSHLWKGKSATFDPIDFAQREWVPHSGWPITRESLTGYLDRAAEALNLGPNVYDDRLWSLMGLPNPTPWLAAEGFRSFFWQFARSRIDQLDIMRFGQEFAILKADNVRVLLNATATRIGLAENGSSFEHIEMSTVLGVRYKVKAKCAVIAAGAVENARLLLVSKTVQPQGIGNSRDLVGRFLMDHAVAQVGTFKPSDISKIIGTFRFYGVRQGGGPAHMYMHGLAPTPDVQQREQLLNSAVYFMPERSPDDPLDALKRLMRRQSSQPMRDLWSVILGARLLANGAGIKVLSSNVTPKALKKLIVDVAIQYFPNFVVEEFQSRGLPHKLAGVSMEIISEQRPDPQSRITVAKRTDRLGVPLPRVDWHINNDERRTIVRLARMTQDALARAGLPSPILEPWIAEERIEDSNIIDFAHTLGTTRMSSDPLSGVVDVDCRVHGVRGLYIAGASTFPTGGHANPTLMILALAIRLADTLKFVLARSNSASSWTLSTPGIHGVGQADDAADREMQK